MTSQIITWPFKIITWWFFCWLLQIWTFGSFSEICPDSWWRYQKIIWGPALLSPRTLSWKPCRKYRDLARLKKRWGWLQWVKRASRALKIWSQRCFYFFPRDLISKSKMFKITSGWLFEVYQIWHRWRVLISNPWSKGTKTWPPQIWERLAWPPFSLTKVLVDAMLHSNFWSNLNLLQPFFKETVFHSCFFEAGELIQQSPALDGQRALSIFGHVLLGDVEQM